MYSFYLLTPVTVILPAPGFRPAWDTRILFLGKKKNRFVVLNMMVYTYNTSTQDAGARLATSSRPTCST